MGLCKIFKHTAKPFIQGWLSISDSESVTVEMKRMGWSYRRLRAFLNVSEYEFQAPSGANYNVFNLGNDVNPPSSDEWQKDWKKASNIVANRVLKL